ncbi:MAG: hypothetical protein MI750_15315 [Xanthomonadales bacterium]|nr:hypothetical protein [Xanthomonadales bacterium]
MEKTVQGDYGVVHWLEEHLIEVVPKQGIEVSGDDLALIYQGIYERSNGYYALLINRENDYSLTFDAHQQLGNAEGLVASAYLVYSEASAQVAEYNAKLARAARCPIAVFQNRDQALVWLRMHLQRYEAQQQAAAKHGAKPG